jgi:hypothetical protein
VDRHPVPRRLQGIKARIRLVGKVNDAVEIQNQIVLRCRLLKVVLPSLEVRAQLVGFGYVALLLDLLLLFSVSALSDEEGPGGLRGMRQRVSPSYTKRARQRERTAVCHSMGRVPIS